MEPMNRFVVNYRQEFKDFVDAICAIPADRPTPTVTPSYTTPLQIMARLPPASREGFPSLPFLIDLPKNFAFLTNTWVKSASARLAEIDDVDPVVMEFNSMALGLYQRAKECMSHAEQAERPNGDLEVKWEELLASMERCAMFHDDDDDDVDNDEEEVSEGVGERSGDGSHINNGNIGNMEKPTPPLSETEEAKLRRQQQSPSSSTGHRPSSHTSSGRRIHRKKSLEPAASAPMASSLDADVDATTPPSSSSAPAYEHGRSGFTIPRWSEPRDSMSSSKNSSTYSLDYSDSKGRRASRDGSSRSRFFDFGKRKKDRNQSGKY